MTHYLLYTEVSYYILCWPKKPHNSPRNVINTFILFKKEIKELLGQVWLLGSSLQSVHLIWPKLQASLVNTFFFGNYIQLSRPEFSMCWKPFRSEFSLFYWIDDWFLQQLRLKVQLTIRNRNKSAPLHHLMGLLSGWSHLKVWSNFSELRGALWSYMDVGWKLGFKFLHAYNENPIFLTCSKNIIEDNRQVFSLDILNLHGA